MITTLEDLIKGEEAPKKELKPIKLVKWIGDDLSTSNAAFSVKVFDYTLNIGGRFKGNLTMIVCWDKGDKPKDYMYYLGHWNDGVK